MSGSTAATGGSGDTGVPIGVVGEADASRGGEDTRRRGWFWHWNSVVTQYSPLLGLKGVGLLNSYTVWTDRREESPHRGYAFPSQQREADFYGEDRAELITINKILVALDLIEIRKEMVLRTDAMGRRWRVPHNFYRVKDQGDGFTLATKDVIRVVELADRDKAVYRYVRRIFSPRFAPIDPDNVWHQMLPVLRQTEAWARLAARTEREETKASDRTRAGHAARRSAAEPMATAGETGLSPARFGMPHGGDDPATPSDGNDTSDVGMGAPAGTSVGIINDGFGSDVAPVNRGSDPDVAGTNDGLDRFGPTVVEPGNDGGPTGVARSNTTYDQRFSTTTTTTPGHREDPGFATPPTNPAHATVPATSGDITAAMATRDVVMGSGRPPAPDVVKPERSETAGSLPTADLAGDGVVLAGHDLPVPPGDGPGEAAAGRAFEDANARRLSPAEAHLLRGMAERFDPAASATRMPDGTAMTGWEWVRAAIYEAVEAGSAFVAPRRLREILTRWERDGYPAAGGSITGQSRGETVVGGTATAQGRARRSVKATRDGMAEPAGTDGMLPANDGGSPEGAATGRLDRDPISVLGAGPDIALPHGFGSQRTWVFTVGLLTGALDRQALADLVAGTSISGYGDGAVTLSVPDPIRAEAFATTYRDLVARKLGEAMRRPVRLQVLTVAPAPSPSGADRDDHAEVKGLETTPFDRGARAVPPAGHQHAPRRASQEQRVRAVDIEASPFAVPECGVSSRHAWSAILAELARSGAVGRADLDTWLRPAGLVGRGEGGSLVVGVPTRLAQRRVSSRLLADLEFAVLAVTGAPLAVEVVVANDWLGAHPDQGLAGAPSRQGEEEESA